MGDEFVVFCSRRLCRVVRYDICIQATLHREHHCFVVGLVAYLSVSKTDPDLDIDANTPCTHPIFYRDEILTPRCHGTFEEWLCRRVFLQKLYYRAAFADGGHAEMGTIFHA